jgi:predicted RNase H-like HicB family nuclease
MAAEAKLCIVRLNDVTQLKAYEGMSSESVRLSDKQYVAYYPLSKDVDHDLILTYEEAKQLGMETLQEHIAKTLSN